MGELHERCAQSRVSTGSREESTANIEDETHCSCILSVALVPPLIAPLHLLVIQVGLSPKALDMLYNQDQQACIARIASIAPTAPIATRSYTPYNRSREE